MAAPREAQALHHRLYGCEGSHRRSLANRRCNRSGKKTCEAPVRVRTCQSVSVRNAGSSIVAHLRRIGVGIYVTAVEPTPRVSCIQPLG